MYTHMDYCPEIGSIESRSKVGNPLVLVKKISHLQLSATLVQRIVTESWKFGGQSFFEDGNLYLKIDYWQKFVNEIQFTHFLGSKRQSHLHPNTCTDENFHVAHVFRFAGAIASPTIVHDAPLPSQPHQEDPLEKQELSSVRKSINLPIRERLTANLGRQALDARDILVSNNAARHALASEIEKLPRFSTPKAWFCESTYSPVLNLPARIHLEQSASRERERSQVISDVDRLCSILDTTTLKNQNANVVPIDSDFKQSPGDSGTQTYGSGNSQDLLKQQDKRSTGSSKPKRNRKRKGKQSDNNGSGSESENGARKRTKGSDLESSHKPIQCRIYTPPDGGRTYDHPHCNGKFFKNFHSMVEHVLRVHIQPIQCELCTNRFGRNSERTRHMNSCLRKQRVKRADEDPNNVPKYVKDMGESISRCKDVRKLDLELYANKKKVYDLLDGTDMRKMIANHDVPEHPTPQLFQNTSIASQEKPEYSTPQKPLNTATDPREVSKHPIPQTSLSQTSHRRASNGGSCAADPLDIEKRHNQNFQDHARMQLQPDFFGKDLLNQHNYGPLNLAQEFTEDGDLAIKIKGIIKEVFNPEEEPSRYRNLINGLLPNLSETPSDGSATSSREETRGDTCGDTCGDAWGEADFDFESLLSLSDSGICSNGAEFDGTVDPKACTYRHDDALLNNSTHFSQQDLT